MIAVAIVAFLAGLAIGFAWGEVRGYRWGQESWAWVPREGAFIVRSNEPVTMERVEDFTFDQARLDAYDEAIRKAGDTELDPPEVTK